MQSKLISTIFLISPIFSKLTQMETMFGELKNKTLGYRGILEGAVQSTLAPIWNYGCWCYFQDDHGKGSGEPQNSVDQYCQALHHAYTCIIMDAADENEACTVREKHGVE